MKRRALEAGWIGAAVVLAVMFLCGIGAEGQLDVRITKVSRTASEELEIEGMAPAHGRCVLQHSDELTAPFIDVPGSEEEVSADGLVEWSFPMGASRRSFYRMRSSPGRTLISWADLEAGFVGTFAIPMAEDGDHRFGYSDGVHAQLSNGNLLVVGHPYFDRQAEVQLPELLDGREGTRVGDWIDITQGGLPAGWEGGPAYRLGGMLEVGSRLHFTKYQWYNGAGTNWQTQGYYTGAYDGSGTAEGMWTVDNPYTHHSRVGGYMSEAPGAIRADGYAYLAGLQGTSGAALGRWGPNLFAVNPVPSDGSVPAATLMCHDSEAYQAPDVAASNATGTWWTANSPANQRWWIANKVTDLEWIETETRHGLICLVYRGLGHTWYGLPDAGPGFPDPYVGGSGFHAEGWALQLWIYDPEDVLDVYRGTREPWSLVPAEAVLLTERLPGATGEGHFSFLTGRARGEFKISFRGNRLIILQEGGHPASEWENTPKGYVINVP